ncbi:MAG TPA: FemAB family XrtA/PEP-CTERM system-associated protein [Candidatus Methylomirabilis sp.]|nr:FemAB family XrtA/PEP-CTERM system-associated protein [Candidatus Methylomirabilis sp.]
MSDDEGARRWDAWVAPRTRTVTDLFAWRHVVRDAYGLGSHLLVAVDDEGRTRGSLGLYEVRHPLFGHYLVTAPFANDGGLHYDDPSARDLLLAEARRICAERRASHVVIRTRGEDLPGFTPDHRYHTADVDLEGGAAALWKRLPAKTRNQVRRGQKEGFEVRAGAAEIEPFYRVFHAHMRELGSPAHALRYYELIAKHLGDHARFIVVREGDTLVAGALLFTINDTAANLQTVALREYNRRCPNYLLYWHMLETSCEAGCTRFDMGRSVEGGPNLAFKENWNPVVSPLSYNYHLRTLADVPFVDPRNPRYRLAIAAWRRLPLSLTRALGPHLISGLA